MSGEPIHSSKSNKMKDPINDFPANACPVVQVNYRRKAGNYLVHLFLLCAVLIMRIPAHAQQSSYAIHANIVYRFTKYINWPEDKKSGDFVIGIVGDSPFYDELKSFIANKTAGSQKIVIRKFSANAAVFPCHILFICEDESKNLKRIATTTSGSSVLLVTESDGLAKKGSCINFAIIDERLKLEINKNNIEHRNLNIASELLNLGILIK